MDIRVCRPGELSAADRAAWSSLQAKAHLHGSPQLANPFLSPEFTLALGRCHAGVRTAVVRDGDGEPAAFFPYQRGPFGSGRAIGLGLSDCQGVVHRPGFTWDARDLLRVCGLAVWEFDHLVEGQPGFTSGITGSFGSPVIDLEQGFPAYLAQLRARTPRFVRGTLYKERKLGRQVGEVRYVHDERDPEVLRTLMAWKSAQYRRTGRGDRFAHGWIVRLAQHLFHTRSDRFAGQLSVLYAGDRPVAAHFGLRSDRVHTSWFPAYDPDFSRYSPGLVMHLRMAEGAAADGISYVDLGRGQKGYKDQLKTREITVHEGWVTRPHPVALARRAHRAPVRAARNAVLARPRLFTPADRLLKTAGAMRSARTERKNRS
ncbi:GNAT family N-acetyltransferase [Streptomyces iconiensis]|uniref:GNAT family N-acetyltransferase n=1 Tax=Streptomyces iconiensis TaxID=1384038 RepID=A0ABT7A950_9ACTN|nr:GNAT family N-acetyltransferase [Streptomyces iconiensis]MDJ1137881.1 GNAT family N-acetyltransferase [Streptomyces iconiensis]